jgi:hypothetical protein
MKVELRKWCLADKKELKELCNAVDRTYLSDRLRILIQKMMLIGG